MSTARMTRTADAWRVTFPFDRVVVDTIKAEVPAHSRTYDPDEKAWYITPAYKRLIHRLLEDVFVTVEVDEEATYSPPPTSNAPRIEYSVLHLQPTAPPELVESAYKCLSRLYHPDRGGDTAKMQELNEAVSTLRQRLA